MGKMHFGFLEITGKGMSWPDSSKLPQIFTSPGNIYIFFFSIASESSIFAS